MIITKKEPFLREEIDSLSEAFGTYIKTVIYVEQKICSAGARMHFENEQELLKIQSKQSDLWGGGLDLESNIIDFNSMINIRPNDGNNSNEIQDADKRRVFEELTKYFFQAIFEK